MKRRRTHKKPISLVASAGPALRRAAKDARDSARLHGTSICYLKDGKIVTEWPRASGSSKTKKIKFAVDAVAMKRAAQAKLLEKTRGMTHAEEIAFYEREAATGALANYWRRIRAHGSAEAARHAVPPPAVSAPASPTGRDRKVRSTSRRSTKSK